MQRSPLTRFALPPLLPAAMGIGTVFYALLAVLAVYIIDDLGLTRAQLGWVVTFFSIGSAVLSPIVGGAIDRIGARDGMLATFGFGAVGFALLAVVPSFLAMIGVVLVLGVSQALANPATNKMIADEFPTGRRGLVTGIKQSGVQAAAFLGGVGFPAMAIRFGWRGVPLLLAILSGALLLLGWVALPRHGHETRSRVAVPVSALPTATWWLTGYALLMGLGGSPVFSFLPLYAVEDLGTDEVTAGLIVGIAGLVGVIARIVWSHLSERRGEFAWPLLMISAGAVIAGTSIVISSELGPWMLWVAAILGYMSIGAWNSVAMLSIIVDSDPTVAGRVSGIVLLGFLTGLGVSPPVFGWSVDRLGTYRPGYVAVTVLFACAALLMFVWITTRARARVR